MPLEDTQQIPISLTALTARDLAALPEDDPWWANVVRDGRVLTLAQSKSDNAIVTPMVTAAMAYSDAITAKMRSSQLDG